MVYDHFIDFSFETQVITFVAPALWVAYDYSDIGFPCDFPTLFVVLEIAFYFELPKKMSYSDQNSVKTRYG